MFNLEDFDIKLDTETISRNFIYCEEVESTNGLLLNSKEFNKDGTVVLAEFQSAGRGRKDSEWLSNANQNLTFSILLKRDFKPNYLNLINLGSSLSIAQALENLYQFKVELKWPNDVLINKKKVAGILLESISKGSSIEKAVIGIGINVNQPNFTGKFLIHPTSVRKEFKREVSRERLMSEILNLFEINLNLAKSNPEKLLNDWKSRCFMLGEKIKIFDGDDSKFGIFDDIDENGFLVLKMKDRTERIHYGDVSLH
ncbi:MAG: biotin--[acetyl-CoA-carboxylase] ligase [Melioribacteraceae bacterium]|nr:biotin--[acetyl-CoA-carboxylase] ligase [Melioribacteraceae bacterium]MCF8355386.1 biotin--[acetyl-CoA-carboxylase] ligase [Melioribacteraceae bacterium]MCF8394631.1 biotin--[acetyl-CoA-carboxylase] ligase [Melioribacteraceae bacterium]MCF8419628.1 biotin--[acetyl-CoA-carboxylase] ligase [Melioribacteraceae bacterium]